MKSSAPILVVDRSAVARNHLRGDLAGSYEVRLAQNVSLARARLDEFAPLGVVVRVEEGSEDELDLIHSLLRRGVPVLAIVTRETQRGTLPAGVGHLCLPNTPGDADWAPHIERVQAWLGTLLRHSSLRPQARLSHLPPARSAPPLARPSASPAPVEHAAGPVGLPRVICIGISTGGPEALESLLRQLPRATPPVVIVQHMPKEFTGALAARLDHVSDMSVSEAASGDVLEVGHALVAPGDVHLRLRRQGPRVLTELFAAPPVDRHRPSVNVLFESAARVLGPSALGVIMTGMGDDGARGLLAMRNAGAVTLAQDAPGCTVFGMPLRAIQLGAAQHVVALDELAERLLDLAHVSEMRRA